MTTDQGIYDMLIARTKTIDELLRAEAPSVQQAETKGYVRECGVRARSHIPIASFRHHL